MGNQIGQLVREDSGSVFNNEDLVDFAKNRNDERN